MGKEKDCTDFERGMIIGMRLAGATIAATMEQANKSKSTVIRIFNSYKK